MQMSPAPLKDEVCQKKIERNEGWLVGWLLKMKWEIEKWMRARRYSQANVNEWIGYI